MLFAREHRKSLSLITGALNAVISVYLGVMWQKLEPACRAVYADMAEEERLAHKQTYPGYVYRPVQKKTVIKKTEFAEKKHKKADKALPALPVFANLAADDLFFDDPFRDAPVAEDAPVPEDLFAEYPFKDTPVADALRWDDVYLDLTSHDLTL